MPGRLNGRVAIVTGAALGIGRAIAIAYGREGAKVVVADVRDEAATETAEAIRTSGGTAIARHCDVSDDSSVRELIDVTLQQFGGIDILVNNAGIPGKNTAARETDPADWSRVIAVNLTGVFLCTKYAIDALERSGRGVILNTASTFGMIGAHNGPAYAASKGGVIALTKQLAVDYGPHNIRVCAVAPGYVDNDMDLRRTRMTPEDAAATVARREHAAALQPIGRQGSTDEIANAYVFLASDEASFMTGSVVTVDGGCTASFNSGER